MKKAINTHCPWSGDPVDEDSITLYKGVYVGFCKESCRNKFEKAVDYFETILAGNAEPKIATSDISTNTNTNTAS